MADHLRAQIRAAAVAALSGTTAAGTRVYATRRTPLQAEQMPAVLVYALAEDAAAETMAPPRVLSRWLDLVIEGVAQDNTALDLTLDALASEIETVIGGALANPASPLRALARAGDLSRTEVGLRPPQSPDEAGTGHIVLTYRVNYRTRSDNPTTNT